MNRINKDNGVRIFPGIHQRYSFTTLFDNINMIGRLFLYILCNTKSYRIITSIWIANADYENRMFILHYLHVFYLSFSLRSLRLCGELFLLFLYPIYLKL